MMVVVCKMLCKHAAEFTTLVPEASYNLGTTHLLPNFLTFSQLFLFIITINYFYFFLLVVVKWV